MDTVCKDHIIGALTWLKKPQSLVYETFQLITIGIVVFPEQDIPKILLSGDKVEESQNHHNKRQKYYLCKHVKHRSSHKSTEDTPYVMMKK